MVMVTAIGLVNSEFCIAASLVASLGLLAYWLLTLTGYSVDLDCNMHACVRYPIVNGQT